MLELQLENTNELIKENDEDLNNFLSSLKIMDNKVEELDNLIVDFFIDIFINLVNIISNSGKCKP